MVWLKKWYITKKIREDTDEGYLKKSQGYQRFS